MKKEKLWLAGGLLAGLAAGAILGILIAPDKGSGTRSKIAGKGKEYMEDLKEKMGEIIPELIKQASGFKYRSRKGETDNDEPAGI